MRKWLIRIVTFLAGLYFVIEFLFPKGSVTTPLQHQQVTDGYIAVGAAALFLGLISLFLVHGGRLLFLKRGWGASLALLCGVLWMFILAGAEWYASEQVAREVRPVTLLSEFSRRIVADQEKATGNDSATDQAHQLDTEQGVPSLKIRLGALVGAVTELQKGLDVAAGKGPAGQDLGGDSNQMSQFQEALSNVAAANQLVARFVEAGDEQSSVEGLNGSLDELANALDRLAIHVDEQAREDYKGGAVKRWYDFTVQGVFSPLSSSMFSLLAFFMAAAAFRAFRVRNVEAALMVSAASLVILGQTPFGVRLIEGLPAIRLWLLEVPNSAAFRAIAIGSSVAALVLAFRMWLSLDGDGVAEGINGGADGANTKPSQGTSGKANRRGGES